MVGFCLAPHRSGVDAVYPVWSSSDITLSSTVKMTADVSEDLRMAQAFTIVLRFGQVMKILPQQL